MKSEWIKKQCEDWRKEFSRQREQQELRPQGGNELGVAQKQRHHGATSRDEGGEESGN